MEEEKEDLQIEINFLWFAMWLFTLGYVKLAWWEAFLSVIFWPYFIGRELALSI